MTQAKTPSERSDMNLDPITGEPGSHPVGTGAGATGGALAGAAVGAIGGPAGAVAGMLVGAVAGGMGGKAVAERINPTAEHSHWKSAYTREPYYEPGLSYEHYAPAYELGWSRRATVDDDFAAVEPSLAQEWETRRGTSSLAWEQARPASHAAWERADRLYMREEDSSFPEGDPLSNDDVVDVLNDVLENTRDGEAGFRTCAEEVETPQLKQLFATRAAQCREAAAQLSQLVVSYGGEPADGGTASGALHRGWVHLKGTVGANSELSILEECERGEDAAVARYRKALRQPLPQDVREVVQSQAYAAQRNHDQIRDLRNEARAARA
ncbi:ferritin-like domain-containing protein [Variovorax paradoxus]|uniref:ferritin-like domain-containing protein n=1 Tax=Variovorax paradoxus TaxID=34073 RepID=UPI0024816BA9|nr:PA2169 family four-helix-bundle protein [Variovorax paradoxus]WGT62469.1 PA2169 family four-helix-bundle protein [Variovorax paradoxus]